MEKKSRQNGFYWYDTMTEEQQLMWVTNVEHSVSFDKKIQDVLEDILNEYYDGFRDFLLDSFDWNESNESYYYWQNLSYRN
jgi:hypothetical protein|tara:strand:+ start:406 stop:648 length:243 start_codon:yes stop_codon:yes gene_type:complete